MKILICGAGALGSWLSTYLAVDTRDAHKITVLDRDIAEERNIRAGTQNYLREQIGLSKVESLQFNIHKFFNRKVEIIHNDFFRAFYGTTLPYDIVVDCFDNKEAREATSFYADREKTAILHVGFSPTFTWSVLWDKGYEAPEDAKGLDICELPGASSFVHMVAAIGSLVVQEYLTKKVKREFNGKRLSMREII
jgi:hypothetical protein